MCTLTRLVGLRRSLVRCWQQCCAISPTPKCFLKQNLMAELKPPSNLVFTSTFDVLDMGSRHLVSRASGPEWPSFLTTIPAPSPLLVRVHPNIRRDLALFRELDHVCHTGDDIAPLKFQFLTISIGFAAARDRHRATNWRCRRIEPHYHLVRQFRQTNIVSRMFLILSRNRKMRVIVAE
jgi:hypothetical protein